MWLFLGLCAICFAICNLIFSYQLKNTDWVRFLSLSFTSLTVCAFYADGAKRVLSEDWSGLMDIMPTMSKALWGAVLLSILINSISLFKKNHVTSHKN